ncbi:NAD(P)H-hydrate dehydratase [Candidatus Nanosalina sp. VS9-1]|uniref:NAD(P)H-hydrate dehydratase n=1 Tax=Candidatus Nanosalina sp. VS9-1 TaxID=3388566 RepID=UPI0039E1626E
MQSPEKLLKKLERPGKSHKGQNGKVGVIGGSRDFSGAPALNARGALRTGSDLVKILTSKEVSDVVRSYSENFIVEDYQSDYFGEEACEKAKKMSEWADAVVVGSGLSSADGDYLKEFAEATEAPLVVDADAIAPLMDAAFEKAVFTPHEAEAEILREKFGSLEDFVGEKDAVVLLKGEKDKIIAPEESFENTSGHATMTVGGTGDVLAGAVSSLIAQGLEITEAARLGAWVNGRAGEISAEQYGNAALATDIAENLPEAFR